MPEIGLAPLWGHIFKGVFTIRKFALTALAILLSGCANIDTINGVRMNATTAPDATYCNRNPTMCILFGAAVVGGLGGIFAATVNHKNSPPSQDKGCSSARSSERSCGPV